MQNYFHASQSPDALQRAHESCVLRAMITKNSMPVYCVVQPQSLAYFSFTCCTQDPIISVDFFCVQGKGLVGGDDGGDDDGDGGWYSAHVRGHD